LVDRKAVEEGEVLGGEMVGAKLWSFAIAAVCGWFEVEPCALGEQMEGGIGQV
jgi:hypothetical protein